MAQHTILSTKQLYPHLKEEMKQKGIEVTEQEFITIKELFNKEKHAEVFPWATREEETAIVFTSRHAVACVNKHLHPQDMYYVPGQWRIFCLSGATHEEVLKYHGPQQILATAANATELADKIIANSSFKEVVFFCGNQRRNELPDKLKANGIKVHEIVVYETVETPQVATGNVDAVLFFSPSAVKSFFSANQLTKDTACIAIGDTTAQAISQYTTNRVIVSEGPSQDLMVVSVLSYLRNIDLYK